MWAGGGLYDQWASFLERWGAGEPLDPASLPRLTPEEFSGDAWARLVHRLTGALSRRLEEWARGVTRALGAAHSEFEVGRVLAQARHGLRPIRALAKHPGLPPDVGAKLVDLVDGQIRSVQRGLEDQIDVMRRGGASPGAVEARLRTVRDNRLTVVIDENPTDPSPGPGAWAVDLSSRPRRRIIDPSTPPRV